MKETLAINIFIQYLKAHSIITRAFITSLYSVYCLVSLKTQNYLLSRDLVQMQKNVANKKTKETLNRC